MTAAVHYDWIANHAARDADKPALIDLTRSRRLTYAVLHDRVGRLASSLLVAGVAPHERVAVLAAPSSDVLEVQFACARIGAIFVPLNWRLAAVELTGVLADAAPSLVFADPDRLDAARAVFDPARVQMLGSEDQAGYERALAAVDPIVVAVPRTHDDCQMLLYTSGTTGLPKGVELTFGSIFWTAANLAAPYEIDADSVTLSTMPMFHTSGLNLYANPVFQAGGTVVVTAAFDAGRVLAAIGDANLGITHFFAVPTAWQALADHPDCVSTDFGRLRVAGVGGAASPIALLDRWSAYGVDLVNGFGMTEGTTVATLTAADARRKAGSVGRPFPHTEIAIFRADHTATATNEIGELRFRGPFAARGYWRQSERSAELFTDGWLHTGDLGRIDADGFLFIVDRAKDMYISGGENVYPAEVERVLHAFADVADAAVIAVPDPRWGETGVAIIVPKVGATLDEAALREHCAARLARYKQPGRFFVVDALPRTASGKIHKPTLRECFACR